MGAEVEKTNPFHIERHKRSVEYAEPKIENDYPLMKRVLNDLYNIASKMHAKDSTALSDELIERCTQLQNLDLFPKELNLKNIKREQLDTIIDELSAICEEKKNVLSYSGNSEEVIDISDTEYKKDEVNFLSLKPSKAKSKSVNEAQKKVEEFEDINVNLLNCELQLMYDNRMAVKLAELELQEKTIYNRCVTIKDFITDISAIRSGMGETDSTELSQEMLKRMDEFKENIWPSLKKENEGVLSDRHNPFKFETNKVTGKDLDKSLDSLTTLLDQEQNAISRVTREVRKITDDTYLITEMTSYRAKHDCTNTMVRNQKTN